MENILQEDASVFLLENFMFNFIFFTHCFFVKFTSNFWVKIVSTSVYSYYEVAKSGLLLIKFTNVIY